ncbi:hypothetical protein [Tessaracoccus lapidicaptus]|uniref:hypothetical protein n=1 Tax=Tessaracoccus lapidicaptus TaxID=1427523 RepID=UPI00333E4AB8
MNPEPSVFVVMQAIHFSRGVHGVPAANEPGPPLPDLPLLIEGLLIEAKRLVDAGSPTETVEEIVDHVAALREGRG